MELFKKEKVNLNQVISLVILAIAFLVAINIYKGQNRKIAIIRNDQSDLKKKSDILFTIRDLKESFVLYKSTLKARDSREIISTIMNLATESGVNITLLRPKEQTSVSNRMRRGAIYDKVFFDLSIQVDSYHQLGKFISRLENDPMMFSIESLRIDISATEMELISPKKMQVDLTVSQLFFKE